MKDRLMVITPTFRETSFPLVSISLDDTIVSSLSSFSSGTGGLGGLVRAVTAKVVLGLFFLISGQEFVRRTFASLK